MSIAPKEKDAVLQLSKYFGERWMVFDVGSNKGAWSDVLIEERDSGPEAGKYEIHLFEPNELLLNFTRVKHDYNKQVRFSQLAICNSFGEIPFYFFTNENSGLSSIIDNPKWNYLPKQTGTAKAMALDYYCMEKGIDAIDIVKIDIEGAEPQALKGAETLLRDKKIKILQVEYSEHYQLTGATFTGLIQFMNSYGYSCWDFIEGHFVKVSPEEFREDYRLENFYFTYLEIGQYQYTQFWNRAFKENTVGLPKFTLGLEIGSFEGLTSNYICDNLLKPQGRLICVDPLEEYYLMPGNEPSVKWEGQFDRFNYNTKGQPVELVRKTSRLALEYLKQYLFDFIYVDGSHLPDDVYWDAVNYFPLLRGGGHLLFDDYTWGNCAQGIDRFLEEYKRDYKVILKNEQVLIKKRINA